MGIGHVERTREEERSSREAEVKQKRKWAVSGPEEGFLKHRL